MNRDETFLSDSDEKFLRHTKTCPVDVSCIEDESKRSSMARLLGEILRIFGVLYFELEALDGATVANDCRAAVIAIQKPPDDSCISEATDLPSTVELARTIVVWRGEQLRFHIVLHMNVAEMLLSDDKQHEALAMACIAHELAHVQHEGRFSQRFSSIYRGPLECGNRIREMFIRAMDVWSEYAACRSSACFRPEALGEHGMLLRHAIEKSLTIRRTGSSQDRQVAAAEMLVCAGYLLGQLDGLELEAELATQDAEISLHGHLTVAMTLNRLRDILRKLWETEEEWESIEVFAPIYDLMLELG